MSFLNPFKWYWVVNWQWMLDFASWINGFKIAGLEYVPFVVIVADKNDKVTINHEVIHHYQQVELLFVFWYLMYIGQYIFNRLQGFTHYNAYMNIIFEKEAYANGANQNYLTTRKLWAWTKY